MGCPIGFEALREPTSLCTPMHAYASLCIAMHRNAYGRPVGPPATNTMKHKYCQSFATPPSRSRGAAWRNFGNFSFPGPTPAAGACFCLSHGDCCIPASNQPLLWKDHLETITPKTRSVWHGGAAISIPATTRSRGGGPAGRLGPALLSSKARRLSDNRDSPTAAAP